MRAVIYARYSSDAQSAASIEDQIRLCRERLLQNGWSLVQTYADRAISGATMLRPAMQGLIQDGMAGQFDIVIAEALDRISRDQEDIASVYKRMSFAGIRIITLAEGEINELHVGLKGTMNALFLKDLADKTRRGLRGRVEGGKSGGGNSYGYDVVQTLHTDGSALRGDRRINVVEAAIVQRIFAEYAAGKSPRRIAWDLNADGISAPGGPSWGPSTINGNAARGTGILNNELYIGELVWNRQRYAKNPDSGKRIARQNPPELWVRTAVPELRIIDDVLWQRVKARQQTIRARIGEHDDSAPAFWQGQRPRTLLSGLMRCGACGGGYSKISATLFGCSTARNKGTCSNRQNIRMDLLETRVLDALRHQLLAPDLFKLFADSFTAAFNQLQQEMRAPQDAARHEVKDVSRKIAKLVAAISEGGPAKALTAEIQRLEARQATLEAELSVADAPATLLLPPNLAILYREKVANLQQLLTDAATRDDAMAQVRSLIDVIVLIPTSDGLEVDLQGALGGILALCAGQQKAPEVYASEALQVKMVAGTGFEPVTFRL